MRSARVRTNSLTLRPLVNSRLFLAQGPQAPLGVQRQAAPSMSCSWLRLFRQSSLDLPLMVAMLFTPDPAGAEKLQSGQAESGRA